MLEELGKVITGGQGTVSGYSATEEENVTMSHIVKINIKLYIYAYLIATYDFPLPKQI